MKRIPVVLAVLGASLLLALPARVSAQQNQTANLAITLPPDGSVKAGFVNGTSSACCGQAWFVAGLHGGRSYSITVTDHDFASTKNSGTPHSDFLLVNLYANDASTAAPGTLTFNPDSAPQIRVFSATLADSFQGSWRYTYVPAAAANAVENLFIKITPWALSNASDYSYFRISVEDTSLYCPWYFTSADYEGFTQVQNTTNTSVTFTLRHYSFVAASGGTTSQVGSTVTFTLPPFGSTFISAKGGAGVPTGSSGGARITHNGPPGAIKANLTTVNATGVGLTHSFNVKYETQQTQPSVPGGR